MTTPSPDKSERESSPFSTATTEFTTTESTITGSTTNQSTTTEYTTSESAANASTTSEPTESEFSDSESSDSDSIDSDPMTTQHTERTDAQWNELREGWTLHRFKEKTEFECHQCNKNKVDILVAMKPEKNFDNMCCNACFCIDVGPDSDEWNLVTVDGIDHIW